MKNTSTYVITALLIALISASSAFVMPAFAGSYDSPKYNRSITVDKKVAMPTTTKGGTTNTYYDNISASTYTFTPGQDVSFEIKVRNTSEVALTHVIVKDFGPQYLFLKAIPGTLDEGSNTLTIEAGDMAINEEKTFTVHARIKPAGQLPTGTTCMTNKAHASADGVADEDTSSLCVKHGTAETIPTTGPEQGLAMLGLASIMGYIGLRLRNMA